MNEKILSIINTTEVNAPAKLSDIQKAEEYFDVSFPTEYRDFLLHCDGLEGAIGENSYLVVWSINEIVECNQGYEVEDYNPGLIYFGSDGGGTAYAFDKRNENITIAQLPFISIDCKEVEFCAKTFNGFLEYLFEI